MEITISYKPKSIDEMVRMNFLVQKTMNKFGARYTGFGKVLPYLDCSRSYDIDPSRLERAKAALKGAGYEFDIRAENKP